MTDEVQVVALSATVADPAAVQRSYLPGGEVIEIPGGRDIEVVSVVADDPTVEVALPAYIRSLGKPEKILVFSNARRRVDDLTASLREELRGLGYDVRAHHGSLDVKEREATEHALRDTQKMVVFSTSTLELGIDIGDIDLVVLDGPPPDMRSLLQRIGRGNRRTNVTRVMACAGSLLEIIVHSAMIESARAGWLGDSTAGPQLAVARQQLASYILQAPRRTRSRNALERLLQTCCPWVPLSGLIDKMALDEELVQDAEGVRLGGEWLDRARTGAIHSNIEEPPGMDVVDEQTGQRIALGISYQSGRGLKAGGLLLQARRWADRKIEVRRVKEEGNARGEWGYSSKGWLTGADQPQALKRYLSIEKNHWPVIQIGLRRYVFHFGGARLKTLIGLLAGITNQAYGAVANNWYLSLPNSWLTKPKWLTEPDMLQLEEAIGKRLEFLEHALARPHANKQLPFDLRLLEVRQWLDLDEAIRRMKESVWAFPADPETADFLRELANTASKS